MEIRQLQTFQTIIAEGSYTKAAQKLAYTQSTITAHMQAIEKAIGAPAFVYQQRQLVLSEQGKLLQPLAEELLMNYQQILALKQMPQLKGELRIAAPESLLIYRLAPLLREYTELYPEVKIILSNASCGVNQQLVMTDQADIAFMMWPELEKGLYTDYRLSKEEIVLVTGKEQSLRFKEYLKNPTNHSFIINEKECSYRNLFEKTIQNEFGLNFPTMELWSIEAIKKALIGGLGFSFLPEITIKEELAEGTLFKLDGQLENQIYAHLVVKKKKWQSPIVEKFIQLVEEKW